jgi:predicted PurR-regulated permease PerM
LSSNTQDSKKTLKLIHLSLVVGLFVLIFMVMRPFIVPLLWSIVFAILLLPAFRVLEERLSNRSQLAAFFVTLGVLIFFILAILPLFWHLGHEAMDVLRSLEEVSEEKFKLWLGKLESIPLIGSVLSPYLVRSFDSGFSNILETLKTYQSSWLFLVSTALSNMASILFGGFFSILSLYFLLANSSSLVTQIRNGALILGGPSYLSVLVSVYETVRATLHGMLLTSFAQGSLAAIAYFLVGAPYPIILTILTALASFIPFGPPLLYIPVAVVLATNGESWIKILLFLAWGIGVVSTADNLLRPLFISRATKLSFLLVLFGIIGGIASFGFLGVFIGPVTMVLAIHLWSDLLKKGYLKTSNNGS